MHGQALELLDELIGVVWSQSSWDEKEAFYLEEHAPRIARSDDPEFQWIDQDNERVILKRLRELMPDDEWLILPELIRARRSLDLQELESDRDRPARLAAWTAALAHARQEGEVRLAREEEERAAAREAEEQERRDRAAEVARRLEDARRAQRAREERDRREAEERSRRDEAEQRKRREAEERAARDEADRATREAEQGALSLGETDQAHRGAEAEPLTDGAQNAASRPPVSPDEGGSVANDEPGDHHDAGDGPAMCTAPPPAPEDRMADDSHDDDDREARLRELADLTEEGLISDEEHEEHRRRITGEDADQEEAVSDDATEAERPDDASESAPPGETADELSSERASSGQAASTEPPDEPPPSDDAAEDEEDLSDDPETDEETPTDNEPPADDPPADDEAPTDDEAPADDAAPTDDEPADNDDEPPVDDEPPSDGGGGGAALNLRGYARRLADAGERDLADAVREYTERVRGVERGELPAALSVAPAAIAPEMVGAALVRRRLEGLLEFFRNVLIFMPVLWTWLKLYFAIEAYTPSPDRNFFDFWVNTGGSVPFLGFLGGRLADAALQVAFILVLLVVVNSLLGMLRARTERRREREARSFAAVLARAEAAGAAHRVEDPQSALAGFAVAATGLTTELRSVGEGLQRSAAPFVEAAEAFADQRRRLDEVIEQLRGIAGMGDQLAALRDEFAEARKAAERNAEVLTGIRDTLDPVAQDLADVAETLDELAPPLKRVTEDFSATHAELNSSLAVIAAELREAAVSMNTVATRVLDEIGDGRSGVR
ncbi:MAG: hypothetical protein OXG35_19140 [Acidobacteria bacterium]|nr:hypothetical protein [Acidobacteriota bacterium]